MKSQWSKTWRPQVRDGAVGLELPRDIGSERGGAFDGNLTAGPNGPSAGPNRRDAMLAAHLERNRGRGPLGTRKDPLLDPGGQGWTRVASEGRRGRADSRAGEAGCSVMRPVSDTFRTTVKNLFVADAAREAAVAQSDPFAVVMGGAMMRAGRKNDRLPLDRADRLAQDLANIEMVAAERGALVTGKAAPKDEVAPEFALDDDDDDFGLDDDRSTADIAAELGFELPGDLSLEEAGAAKAAKDNDLERLIASTRWEES